MIKFSNLRIQTQIFIWYSAIVLVVVFAVGIGGFSYLAHTLSEQEKGNAQQLSSVTSSQLDMVYEEMQKICLTVIFNQEVTSCLDSIYNRLDTFENDQNSLQQTVELRTLIGNLVSINGPFPSIYNINIIYPEENFLVGIQNEAIGNISSLVPDSLIESVESANGRAVILPPHNDYWLENKKIQVISVLREKKDIYGKSYGWVEVQQSYDVFEKICNSSIKNKKVELLILDQNMEQIYPLAKEESKTFQSVRQKISQYREETIPQQLLIGDQYYSLEHSEITGFTVVAGMPYHELMKPVRQMQFFWGLMLLLLLTLSVVFTYWLSHMIGSPVQELCKTVNNLEFTVGKRFDKTFQRTKSLTNYETNHLNEAFENMLLRLQASADDLAETRANELESFIYALQAQINPHFIHNVLTNVSAIADDYGIDEISDICYLLSKILRYSLSDASALTNIKTEFEQTEIYFRLLRQCYGPQLQYSIDLDPELNEVMMPKLILQPLVENTILHGKNQKSKNWIISVEGKQVGKSYWEIVIQDSGNGFSEEALNMIQCYIEKVKSNDLKSVKELPHGIGGLGLKNVIFRMSCFFGTNIQIEAMNQPGAGAYLRFQGPLEKNISNRRIEAFQEEFHHVSGSCH